MPDIDETWLKVLRDVPLAETFIDAWDDEQQRIRASGDWCAPTILEEHVKATYMQLYRSTENLRLLMLIYGPPGPGELVIYGDEVDMHPPTIYPDDTDERRKARYEAQKEHDLYQGKWKHYWR
jgi:hypothetical protein